MGNANQQSNSIGSNKIRQKIAAGLIKNSTGGKEPSDLNYRRVALPRRVITTETTSNRII